MEGILLHYPLQERYRKVKHGKKNKHFYAVIFMRMI